VFPPQGVGPEGGAAGPGGPGCGPAQPGSGVAGRPSVDPAGPGRAEGPDIGPLEALQPRPNHHRSEFTHIQRFLKTTVITDRGWLSPVAR